MLLRVSVTTFEAPAIAVIPLKMPKALPAKVSAQSTVRKVERTCGNNSSFKYWF
jgi:hypothetical protein